MSHHLLQRNYHIPRRLHPGYSLLGYWLRKRADDRVHAESVLIVAIGVMATALLIVTIAAWALTPGLLLACYGLWLIFLTASLAGIEPSVSVEMGPDSLSLSKGSRRRAISYRSIGRAETLDALTFHRRHRRDVSVEKWVNSPVREVLLLKTTDGPVVLGLLPADHDSFFTGLDERLPGTDEGENRTLLRRTE